MPDQDPNLSNSRLHKHLDLLGIEKLPNLNRQALEKEKEFVDSIDLPNLNLPSKKTRSLFSSLFNWQVMSLAGVVACISLIIFVTLPQDESGIVFKGEGSAAVYVKSGTEIKKFKPGMSINSGDQFRVEVTAAKSSVAFLGVFNANGEPLSSKSDILASKLVLNPGEKQLFAGSIALVGENEGETAYVYRCSADGWQASYEETIVALMRESSVGENCALDKFRLR